MIRLELDSGLDDSELDEEGVTVQTHPEWQSDVKIKKRKVIFTNITLDIRRRVI